MTYPLPRTRRLAAVAALAMLLAACTTEEQSTPGPTLTSTTSTSTTSTSTTSTTTTSTTVAPTTTAPPDTTTTIVPTGPADVLVPLFVGGADSVGWLFLGAWQQDQWQQADPSGNPIRLGIEAGTPFTVSNLAGETSAALGANVEACSDERVGPAIDVVVTPPDLPGFGYDAVAVIEQAWPLKPRPVAVTASAPDAYRALGEAAFSGEPVDASQGAIEQVVVADLDGDGDDEALAAFEFVQPSVGPGAPGDLAAVLLIDVDTRVAETLLLSAVDEDVDADTFPLIERYRVLDVADLNGDGRMEVLVHAWYYEGASVLVYTYDGSELTEVLAAGCGA